MGTGVLADGEGRLAFPASVYDAAFRGVTPDPEVLEKARFQPEFVQPLWQYVEKRVSDKRIAAGRDMLARHRPLLDQLEGRYGVDRHILVADLGPGILLTARCSPTRRS